MTDQNSPKKDKHPHNIFRPNSRYFTICIYAIVSTAICAGIIRAIFMWESTISSAQALIQWAFPYLLGIFLTCVLYPLYSLLQKLLLRFLPEKYSRFARGLAILTAFILFIGMFVLAICVILPQVWASVQELIAIMPIWYAKFMAGLLELQERFPELDVDIIIKKVQELGNAFFSAQNIQEQLQTIIITVLSTSFSVVSLVLDVIISLIVAAYLLIDLPRIRNASHRVLRAFADEAATEKICTISNECYSIFSRFVSGKMLDSLIIGILCFFAMTLLRLPYALVISVVIGITNMIPYFGPFIGAVPGCFILLMVSPVKMLIYLILVLVLQQFDGLYLGPKILGDSTGLRPAWIIFSVSAGGAVCGVLGMFIGVPIVAVIGHLISIWIDARTRRRREFSEEISAASVEETAKSDSENL